MTYVPVVLFVLLYLVRLTSSIYSFLFAGDKDFCPSRDSFVLKKKRKIHTFSLFDFLLLAQNLLLLLYFYYPNVKFTSTLATRIQVNTSKEKSM